MGRKTKKVKKRSKNSKNPADSKPATSASNTEEVKMDGNENTKISDSCSDEIREEGNFPSTVTEEQSSGNKLCNMSYEEINEMLNAITRSTLLTIESIFSIHFEQETSSISEKLKDFDDYLESEYPDIFGNMVTCIRKIEEQLCIRYFPNIQEKLNKMSRSGAFGALIAMLKEQEITDQELEKTEAKDGNDEITTDVRKEDGSKVEIKDDDDIQKTMHSMQQLAIQKNGEKIKTGIVSGNQESEISKELEVEAWTIEREGKEVDTEIAGYIQDIENNPHDIETDVGDEELMKIIDAIDKNTGKSKDSSEVKHINEMLNLSSRRNSSERDSFPDFQHDMKNSTPSSSINETNIDILRQYQSIIKTVREMQSFYFLKKALEEKFPEKIKEIRQLKEKADQVNDIELEKNDNSIDYVEKEKKSSSSSDFKHDWEEIMILLKRKIDETAKENRDLKLEQIFTEEARDSLETEPLAAITEAESNEATNNKDERDVDTSELDEPSMVVEYLNKDDYIHFEIETSTNKHIFAGEHYYYYSSKENQTVLFIYKDENVQVSFRGNRVYITTDYSEFNISIRKSTSVDATDEATQV